MFQLVPRRNTLEGNQALAASRNVLSNYEITIGIYANQMLTYNSNDIDSFQPTDVGYLNENTVQCSFSHYMCSTYKNLVPRQFNESNESNTLTNLQEQFTFMWSHYMFLAVATRHFSHTPRRVRLNRREIRFPTYNGGRKISGYSRISMTILKEFSKNLLNVIRVLNLDIEGAEATLHLMRAYAGWIKIIYQVRKHRDFRRFVLNVFRWNRLKKRAKRAIERERGPIVGDMLFTGCIDWLREMNLINISRRREARALFHELTNGVQLNHNL